MFRIAANGNVGIGTASPSTKLDVYNTSTYSIANFKGLENAVGLSIYGARSSGEYWRGYFLGSGISLDEGSNLPKVSTNGFRGSAIGFTSDGSQGHIGFFTSTSTSINSNLVERMRITSNGNIGIGTTSPSAKLDIFGDSENLFRVFNTSSGQDNDRFNINIKDNLVTFLTDGSTTPPNILFKLFNIDALYIGSSGIGIGTTNSTAKLAVNGTIKAKEVNVTLDGWSDFVFHPTYKLRPLGEVEQFIKANNHLPGIPSETEVKQNGVGLGEMNAKLLQRIEELTLYVIEQQKQINELKEQNSAFAKEIEAIKK